MPPRKNYARVCLYLGFAIAGAKMLADGLFGRPFDPWTMLNFTLCLVGIACSPVYLSLPVIQPSSEVRVPERWNGEATNPAPVGRRQGPVR